jgi:hypothetical protein
MYWRSAHAAYKAGCLADWHTFPQWLQSWIIATVETEMDIANLE